MSTPQNSATSLPEQPIKTGALPSIVVTFRWLGSIVFLMLLLTAIDDGFALLDGRRLPHHFHDFKEFGNACFGAIIFAFLTFSFWGRGARLVTLDESGLSCARSFGGTIPWRRVRACTLRSTGILRTLRFFLYPGAYEGIVRRRFVILWPDHFDVGLGNADAGPILAACRAWIAAARAARPQDQALYRIDAEEGDGPPDDLAADPR